MELDILSTHVLMAIVEEIVPQTSFFKDRYFPTGDGDIFTADKVLVEYQSGDNKLAAFVAPRTGDIPVARRGYEIREFEPPYIAPSRLLTVDDLNKRGFGEALFGNTTRAERATRIVMQDLKDLDLRITRREEWMAVQTMINNACDMQEYVDAKTTGEIKRVQFYDTTSKHVYTVANRWDTANGKFFDDVHAMSQMLAERGLPAADLVLGAKAGAAIRNIAEVRELLDIKRMEYGALNPNLTTYPGVAILGALNFDGFILTIWVVTHSYTNNEGVRTPYFPATSAMVTAPACGHLMYGQVTQIDHGSTEFTTYAGARVPKLTIDTNNDVRKLRVASRPLAAPVNDSPYIYAANVVS